MALLSWNLTQMLPLEEERKWRARANENFHHVPTQPRAALLRPETRLPHAPSSPQRSRDCMPAQDCSLEGEERTGCLELICFYLRWQQPRPQGTRCQKLHADPSLGPTRRGLAKKPDPIWKLPTSPEGGMWNVCPGISGWSSTLLHPTRHKSRCASGGHLEPSS